jgi:hypothetical protein
MNINSVSLNLAKFLPQETSLIYICVDRTPRLEGGLDLQTATHAKVPVVLRLAVARSGSIFGWAKAHPSCSKLTLSSCWKVPARRITKMLPQSFVRRRLA